MMQDPLAFFYEVVCVGLEWDDIMTYNDDLIPTSPAMNSGQGGVLRLHTFISFTHNI